LIFLLPLPPNKKNTMGVLTQILQLLLSLGLLVLVHELGHFATARMFRTRVDKFYLFFNPWRSILRAKRFDGRWHLSWLSPAPPKDWSAFPDNTEWGIGWLPLGGYCKIAGMVDESMDKEQLAQPVQPYEFRAKPAWQRLIIITAGVVVNFVTALAIYAAMLFTWGQEYLPLANATYGYDYCQTALDNGFRSGDRILTVNGKCPETLGDAVEELVLASGSKRVSLLRGADTTLLALPADFSQQLMAAKVRRFAVERIPFVIDKVNGSSPADEAQLQSGDSVVAINGADVAFFQQISDSLLAYAAQPITLSFYRNGELSSRELTPTENGKIGVLLRNPMSYFTTKRTEYSLRQAIPAGIALGAETLVSYVRQLKLIFTREGVKQLGGFGTFGSMFPEIWHWHHFWSMTGFISIMLAFLNILPIPALDGGHMMFILYEMLTRRKPSDKFMERAQTLGLLLLILLLVYANGNDIVRWLGSK
jgi:regulator of sigma E protease